MSWLTAIWSMIAAACLTLAGIYLPVWIRDRTAWPSFFFSAMAIATAVFAFCELAVLRAPTPQAYASAVGWAHVPLWALIVSLVAFVRVYFQAGRLWLGWTVVLVRSSALVLNFTTGDSLNHLEITAVRQVLFLGEPVSVAVGTPNPWRLVAQASVWLLVIYLADASVTAWRRGRPGAALSVGGSALLFAAGGITQSMLVLWGVIRPPITISLFFLGVIVAMAAELSRDVLRAARLARELRESQLRMTLAADAAKLGIWVRDLERSEVWANAKARELIGVAADEPLDQDKLLLKVHPDDRDAVRQLLANASVTNSEYLTEYRVRLPDGGIRWIETQGRVDFDEEGRPTRTRGAFSDITTRRQAEQELQRLHQEIAHAGRVTVMGQLAASLAHEINQPLGAILRNAEAASLLLQVKPPDLEELRAIVEDILADDQRAGAVIDRMRAMLKRQEMALQPVGVDELVNDVARLVRPDAAARQVKLTVEVAQDAPPVLGDRVHLQQVLLNLIANAMDSIDESGQKVRQVIVRALHTGAQTVEIAVCDSGAGIPADSLEKIFASFFTTKAAGMGMGLSISRSLVEAHGGRLWAENRSEGGARLRLTLPVAG